MKPDATKELTRLLTHWRAARHESTSELIHVIGKRVKQKLPPFTKSAQRDIVVEWLELTASEGPATLSLRIAQIEPLLRQWTISNVWPVFEGLATRAADPRLASLAVRTFKRGGLNDKIARRLINMVETHGDHSHWRALDEAGTPRTLFNAVSERLRKSIDKGLAAKISGAEVPGAERSTLLAVSKWEVGEPTHEETDFFSLVYEAPNDLSRRQVLADALLEKNDPRGEFIALQLAKTDEKRQAALLSKNLNAWLGPFAKVAKNVEFENGFVSSFALKPLKITQFQALSTAREWATVKWVQGHLPGISRAMKSLEDPGVIEMRVLRAADFPLPFSRLTVWNPDENDVAVVSSLPQLKLLEANVDTSKRAMKALLSAKYPMLTSLTLTTRRVDHGVDAWLSNWKTMKPSTFVLKRDATPLMEMRRRKDGFELHLHRANDVPAELLKKLKLERPQRIVGG